MSRKKNTRRAGYFGEQQRDGQNVGTKSHPIGVYSMNKIQTKYQAEEIRRRNPDFWHDLVSWSLNEAAHGRRFSISYFIERYRWHDRVNSEGEPFKINDHYSPIWARMIATEHPEVRPYIELRKSMWDDDYPEAFDSLDGNND